MKSYLIYEKDKFLGFADNKKRLKDFLKNRKGTYKIIKINDKKIPDRIKKSITYDEHRLGGYEGYHGDSDTTLFYYEQLIMEQFMMDDACAIQYLADHLIELSEYIKFDKNEQKIINHSLKYLIDFMGNITESNEILYDECYNIRKYFYERYFKLKKDQPL